MDENPIGAKNQPFLGKNYQKLSSIRRGPIGFILNATVSHYCMMNENLAFGRSISKILISYFLNVVLCLEFRTKYQKRFQLSVSLVPSLL